MNGKLKEQVLLKSEIRAHAVKIAELEQMLGTWSARDTARPVPFFGPREGLKAPVVPADPLHLVCNKQGTLSLHQVGDKQVLSGSVQLRD